MYILSYVYSTTIKTYKKKKRCETRALQCGIKEYSLESKNAKKRRVQNYFTKLHQRKPEALSIERYASVLNLI